MINRNYESGAIYPGDLDLLKRVFDKLCLTNGYAPDSAEAEATTLRLLNLFQTGRSSEEALLEAVQPQTELRRAG
jgi:hypothetical protein